MASELFSTDRAAAAWLEHLGAGRVRPVQITEHGLLEPVEAWPEPRPIPLLFRGFEPPPPVPVRFDGAARMIVLPGGASLHASSRSVEHIVHWRPDSLRAILEFALRTSHALGRAAEAMPVLGAQERRLKQWRDAVGIHRRAPDAALPVVALLSEGAGRCARHWGAETVDRAAALLALQREELASPAALDAANPDLIIAAGSHPEAVDSTLVEWCRSSGTRLVHYAAGPGLLEGAPGITEAIGDLMHAIHGVPEREGARVTCLVEP